MKGGYQPTARLESALDEISMEVMATLAEPASAESWRKAFEEIARLARDAKGLLSHMNGGAMPPMATAGA